jgi:uncharacterized protein (DUF1800 family)
MPITTLAMAVDALLAHLYRRAGFGATRAELADGAARGYAGSVDHLIEGLTRPETSAAASARPTFDPFGTDIVGNSPDHGAELLRLTDWWVAMMSSSSSPLREKLTLLLHCQFPTAYSKVNVPSLLYRQNEIFRNLGHGRFDELTRAVSKDPAMLIWLDAGSDLRAHPNENFSRELMERFTMGVGTYTQSDVTEAARAFTGWSLNYSTGEFQINAAQYDPGWKNVLSHGGYLDGDAVIDIVTHTPASSHWVVSRLWSWLAYPVGVHHPVVAELAPSYAKDMRLSALLRAILNHPQFISAEARSGLVKQPVEYVVGALRAFDLSPAAFAPGYVMGVLAALGQQLFNPPTVGGWGDNRYWLSTSNSLEMLKFATTLSSVANLSELESLSNRRRIATLAERLGIAGWSPGTAQVLQRAAYDPASLVTMALVSPEYLAN